MEDGSEESWDDANEDGWGTTCGKAKDKAAKEQEEEAEGRAEEDKVRNWHDRGPIGSVFRFGWDVIRAWIIRPKPDRGASQCEVELQADR